MSSRWMLVAALGLAMCGCTQMQKHDASEKNEAMTEKKRGGEEGAEAGEVKVKLDQTPPAVKATIQRELVGAELEDISKKQRQGKTIYETDIIKNGHKWEVIVGEDGSIISNKQEGKAEEEKSEGAEKESSEAKNSGWRETFSVNKADLRPTGNNSYIPIQPGKVLKMRNKDGDTLTITILPETKQVDGVTAGVLEERETKNHQLEEVSRNFFATDPATNDVYYFGEDVDNYKDGKIISHDSAWHAGEKGARFGLMIPGKPKVGDKFFQEVAPKVALDRVEVVSTSETLKTPAGTFENCVHLKETTPLESDVSHKWYAPGVGMVKDDEFELAQKP